jgi:hypothetical protein
MVGFCYRNITVNNFLVQTNDFNGYYHYKYDDTEFYIKSCKYNIIIDDFGTSEIINDKSKVQIVKNYFEVLTNFIDIIDKFKSESIKKKLLAIQSNMFGKTDVSTINERDGGDFDFEYIIDALFSKQSDIYLATNTNKKLNILNINPSPFIIKITDPEYLKKLTMLKSNVRTAVLNKEDYDKYEDAKKQYEDKRNNIEKNLRYLKVGENKEVIIVNDNNNIRNIEFNVNVKVIDEEEATKQLKLFNEHLFEADNQNKEITKKLEEANIQEEVTTAYLEYAKKFDTNNPVNDVELFVKLKSIKQVPTGGNPPKYKSTGNTVFILYKKKKYKRTIYVKDKKKAKYCKINNEYILLSKLKIIT